MTRVVLDTNVLVAALLNPRGAPAQVLLLAISEPDIQLCASGVIFIEYEEVLRRPLFHRSESEIQNALRTVRENALWVRPTEKVRALLRSGRRYLSRARASGRCALRYYGQSQALPQQLDRHTCRYRPAVLE